MTYESTGEIRKPLIEEYYLTWSPDSNEISRMVEYYRGDDLYPEKDWKRIIMRPLEPDFDAMCEKCKENEIKEMDSESFLVVSKPNITEVER